MVNNITESKKPKSVLYRNAPIAVAVSLSLTAAIVSLWRLDSWHATGMDMAWYSQALWLIGQGHWKAYDTMVGFPALADSASYVLYPIGLLYRVIGQPGILVLQILALGSGYFGLFYYFNKYNFDLPNRIGWILLYAFYPAVVGPALFDWHPDVVMIPAFFLAIWAYETRHIRLFLLGILLAAATKDVGAAVAGIFGVELLLRREKIYGGSALAIGLGVVLLDLLVVLPGIYPHGIAVWQATYGWLGSSPGKALANLLAHPTIFLQAWTRQNVIDAWVVLLMGFGFLLPFWGARYMPYGLPVLAVFAFNGLSGFDPQIYAWHQYWIPAVPFLFAASMTVWPKFPLSTKWLFPSILAGMLLLLFSLASGQLVTFYQPHPSVLNHISHKIPPEAPVLGMNKSMALLANRPSIQLIDGQKIKSSVVGTYAFMDLNDMSQELVSSSLLRHWFQYLRRSSQWKLVTHHDNIWLFVKIGRT